MSLTTIHDALELRRGKRLVFTNGVFDILHAGHIALLTHARSLGDLLVVGINSDESVRALGKGPNRPVHSLADRAIVLAALRVVDAVVSFSESTPLELIAALLHNPRVLFLDEPTIGLDAVAQKQMRAFLREVNRARGTTILLTSHYMEDIRSLCARCVVINGGRAIYDGTLNF